MLWITRTFGRATGRGGYYELVRLPGVKNQSSTGAADHLAAHAEIEVPVS
jgi:hypothetical protein